MSRLKFLLAIGFTVFFAVVGSCKSADNKKGNMDIVSVSSASKKQSGTSSAGKKQKKEINCKIVFSGSYNKNRNSVSCEVVRSEKEFISKLGMLNIDAKKSGIKIDFNKQAAIFAYAGTFNTGGYGIELEKAALEKGVINVSLKIVYPEAGAIVTQAFTQPYAVLVVDAEKNTKVNAFFNPKYEKENMKTEKR